MKKLIIILAAAAMAGCGIYKPYTRPEEIKTDGLQLKSVSLTFFLPDHFPQLFQCHADSSNLIDHAFSDCIFPF